MVAHHNARREEAGLQARSISRWVWAQLQREAFHSRVLAVFDRACSLVTTDGDVIALVLPQIGDGPLNIVVDGAPGDFALIEPGTPTWMARDCLQVGEISVSLANTSVWDPRPDWDGLRACHKAITQQLSQLRTTALRHAPECSLLALLPNHLTSAAAGLWSGRSSGEGSLDYGPSEPPQENLTTVLLASARRGAEAVKSGWKGDVAWLEAGAAQLAGLGGGLTPAGDDFLTGVMMWAWLAHPTPRQVCHTLLKAAVPHTTTLSAAFLQAAARGECSAPWHRLLIALEHGTEEQLAKATRTLLAYGHTSGADALAGFLWMERESSDGQTIAGRGTSG